MRAMELHSQTGHVYAIYFRPNPGSGDDNELVSGCIQGTACRPMRLPCLWCHAPARLPGLLRQGAKEACKDSKPE